MKTGRYVLILFLILVLYLIAWPIPINPISWTPLPAPELKEKYAINDYLSSVKIIETEESFGPEDVDMDEQGRIYGGFEDGKIIRFSSKGENMEVFADTKGRPLGLDFDNSGNLIIADAKKGLLSIDKKGNIKILVTEINGVPLGFTDDVDVGPDNMIYFTDASEKFRVNNFPTSMSASRADLWEHQPYGKIIRYNPSTTKSTLLLDLQNNPTFLIRAKFMNTLTLNNKENHSPLMFTDAINFAYIRAMQEDKTVLCYGLGVNDPNHIFNTTTGLKEKFGEERVFEMPTSENAMTGVGIGLALNGYRPIMVHQRLDFFLLAMDQLVNNASKWFHMSAGDRAIPLTIRLILGRGWGQGSTHSQALHAWFNHIPGLKVVMPSLPDSAEQLFYNAIMDNNPVVFLEHRWLHNLKYDPTNIIGHYNDSLY